jgi:hypothetical protein
MKESAGWALLILGILLIIWGIYYSYQIFTLKTEPPQIFKVQEKENGLSGNTPQEQLEVAIKEQIESLLPGNAITELLNLVAWSMFAVILFMGSSHIAVLGIRLIK